MPLSRTVVLAWAGLFSFPFQGLALASKTASNALLNERLLKQVSRLPKKKRTFFISRSNIEGIGLAEKVAILIEAFRKKIITPWHYKCTICYNNALKSKFGVMDWQRQACNKILGTSRDVIQKRLEINADIRILV